MTFLVAGADQVDAGKTTFTTGLVSRLDAVGFKPRAGNDIWFHHDDYRNAIEKGRMYGKDARRLADASATDVEPEDINPVHRVWRPAPEGDGFLGPADKQFVLDRVGEGYVVNGNADVPESVRETLPLDGAPVVTSIAELNEQIKRRHLPHLEALAQRISETDTAVVESYGDVARPLQDIDLEGVAVVEPGRARIYDGDRYWKACEVASGSTSPREGILEERVEDVIAPLDATATVELPPLPGEVRTEPNAVADAYHEAYEALVE